ncbi:PP2C family protein-serine/threonine phosphatase [Spirillospora sp. NPDC049652]
MPDERFGLSEILAAAENAAPVASVGVVARNLRDRFDAVEVSFLFADLLGRRLVRLNDEAATQQGRTAEQIPLAGSVYEEVLRTQELTTTSAGERGQCVIAPVTNRGDTIGVLELTLPEVTEKVREEILRTAHALAYIIVTDRRFTDLYHWGQRTTVVSLAAEIQHQLLPAATCCEGAEFTLASALVPADSIGGDTYDYSLDCDTLHLSITDAMGHDLNAALLATLLVNASRGARRDGSGLVEQAARTHQVLLDHGREALATGLLLRVSLKGQGVQVVNAGHPLPLLLRAGKVEQLFLTPDLPFGTPLLADYHVQNIDLRPGDRLVLYTDGMQERQAGNVDLPALMHDTVAEHPREVVQALTGAVHEATNGELEDDATIMCLDWHGPHPEGRQTQAGSAT